MSAKGRGSKTNDFEFYETPEWVCKLAMKHHDPCGLDVFEPGCDTGPFLRQAKASGARSCVGMEIRPVGDQEWVDKMVIGDFLDYTSRIFSIPEKFDYIYTNPPFTLAHKFVRDALTMLKDGGKVVMLQRLNWLSGDKRYKEFFRHIKPEHIHVLVQRPRFIKGRGGDACDYGLFVFERDYSGTTTVDWVSRKEG